MRTVGSELASIAYFVIVGWAALWPMRNRLGATAYHLAALPVGLVSAPLTAALTTLAGRPLDALGTLVGGLVFVGALWLLQHLIIGPSEETGAAMFGGVVVGGASFAFAGGAIAAIGAVVGLARYTVANADSYVSYWPLGVEIARTGAVNMRVFASRGTMLPGLSAVHVVFGSDWAYVIYPMLALTLLGWLALTLWAGTAEGLSRRARLLVIGGAAGFLALEPSFLFNSVFVHSHMLSALYLFMSLSCLWMAAKLYPAGPDEPGGRALLILSGLFTAGFALTRTDGLAYQFIAIATAISVLTLSRVRGRSVAAYFAPLFVVVFGVFAEGYLKLGMWQDAKLSGKPAAMILAVLAFSVAGPWIVQAVDRVVPIRVRGERFLGILVAVAAVLVVAVFALKWQSAQLALLNTRINLFQGYGGYFYLWYAVVVLLVISAFAGDMLRFGSWTRWAFLSTALFYLIAALVHGTSHAGRIGVGDSLNRVVFHALPIIVFYVAAVIARILSARGPESD